MTRFVTLTVFVSLFCVATAQGALHTLTDLNSTTVIDDGSSAGMSSWTVDGTDHVSQQWFWYRIGDTGPESSLETLDATPLASLTNADFDPGNETLNLRYEDSDLRIDVSFALHGGASGSGASDIAEVVTITNLTDNPVPGVHLFQYVDFDLSGAPGGDTAWIATGGGATSAWQTGGGGWVNETPVTSPSRYEVAFFSATRDKLTDVVNADILNNVAGPVGPGNVTWAFQWDFDLEASGDPNSSWQLSKDKRIVIPEPATLVVLIIGGLLSLLARRRRA